MAKVPLRAYNREIEGMIEGGQLDEAIVHCQYILKAFPMYVETYRLLGKAFLEARRYTDAADIFQRVLMAAPDDFVAHVGMSIILDNEGKLDDSVWHMERAFELQPSNPAIQGELRRLYGRRDGVEPAKIRLSRDALANMYAQGELFNQAIAEIRSVLADDPNRLDLQVMLARAYYRSGQKVEAAEVAAALLKKYPYCLDALRVLVDVLPDSTRSENIQAYRRRLRLLDPYSSFVTDSVFASDQVADTAVSLDRFDYGASPSSDQSQSEWASSLSFDAEDEEELAPKSDQPEADEPEKPLPLAEPSVPSAQAAEGDLVPDWMRSAGWQESTGTDETSETPAAEELPAEPILKADIPDWLKAMAPPEVTDMAKAEPEPASEPKPDAPPAAAETPSSDAGAMPDWLVGLVAGSVEAAASEPAQVEERPVEPEQVLAEEQTTPPEPAAQETGEPPAWIAPDQESTLLSGEEPSVESAVSVNEEPLSASSPEIEEISSSFEETQASQPAPEGEPQAIDAQEDTVSWLARLAVEPEETQDESPATPTSADAAPSDAGTVSEEDVSLTSWLNKLEAAEETEKFAPPSLNAEQPPAPVGDLPDWLKDFDKPPATTAPLSEAPRDDDGLGIPAWADENAPIAEEAAPTAHTEWLPAEKSSEETGGAVPPEISAPMAESASEAEAEAAPAGSPETPSENVQGEAAATPAPDQDDEILAAAQAALDANTPGDAMKEYGKLIKKGHLLDEIIHDLQEAIYRFPVDVIVWQTLGDAYMRANRLQDALDAYTKAEELLR